MTTQNVFEKFFSSIFGGSDDDAVEQKAQLRPKARPEGLMSSLRPKARPTSEETEEPDKDATMGFVNKMLPYYSRKSNTTAVLPFSASRQAFMNNSTLLEELQAQREASVSGLTTVTARSGGRYSPIDTLLANSNKFIDDEADDLAFKTRLALGRKPEVKQPMVDSKLKQEFDPKSIQQNLVDKGYKIAVDGIIGTQTKKAIKDFQRKSGLKDDGIVGPNTARALGFDSSASEVTTETLSPADIPEQIGLMERLSTPNLKEISTPDKFKLTPEQVKQVNNASVLGFALPAFSIIPAHFKQFIGSVTGTAIDDVKTEKFFKSGELDAMRSVIKANIVRSDDDSILNKILEGGDTSDIKLTTKQIQTKLKNLGFLKGSVDGNMGNQTRTAIKSFQKKFDLSPDGKVGALTTNKLLRMGAVEYKDYTKGLKDVGWVENIDPLSLFDKEGAVKKTLGQFNWRIDDNGNIIVTDQYNFNNAKAMNKAYPTAEDKIKYLSGRAAQVATGDYSLYGWLRDTGALYGTKSGEGTKFEINLGPAN